MVDSFKAHIQSSKGKVLVTNIDAVDLKDYQKLETDYLMLKVELARYVAAIDKIKKLTEE